MSYISPQKRETLRSCLDSGLAAHRRGDFESAIATYKQALLVAPDDPVALNLLGTALLQLGRAGEAMGFLQRAVQKQRDNGEVLANLAQCCMALERYDEAEAAFRKATRLDPRQLHFQLGTAGALALQGKPGDAEALLRRLGARFPGSSLVWFNLGNALRDQKRAEEAVAAYRKALELDADFVEARNNLGSVLHSTLRFGEAETAYRECIARAPDHLLARYNLASVVMDLGRFEEAEALSRDLLARAPRAPEAFGILGAALGHQSRVLEAAECHRAAARLAPGDYKVAMTLAGTLMEIGQPARGLREFVKALASQSDTTSARTVLATALLAHGSLQDGWREYECRPAAVRLREKYAELALTRTLPSDLRGKHIVVLREQGLGDEIFFLRYAPLLAARGARISYRAGSKIASVVSRVECIAELVDESAKLPAADAYIMVGDLPHALGELHASPVPLHEASGKRCAVLPDFERRTSLFWPPVPATLHLPPLPERRAALSKTLAALGPPPYIGVTWRAGTHPEEQTSSQWVLYKTIPLAGIAAALRHTRATVLALQRNPAAGEIDALSAALGRPVHDLTDLNEDLDGMLALLALIDEYVTVSNTNVHLRAAAGRTARMLVRVPAEWRWMQSGRLSPWFPGFPLYRQSLQGDWGAALEALARDLQTDSGAPTIIAEEDRRG